MNPDIFAEWLRRRGQLVVQTKSSYWASHGPRAFQAFPYHWLIEPTQAELQDFLKKYKAVALRYSTPLSSGVGHISYHAVLENTAYDFANLGKWARKNVRRGLSCCRVEPISFQRLADEGFLLQVDTLDRQGRKLDLEHGMWKMLCSAACDLPGFEAWGAIVDGKLAASVITFRMDDCYYMLYQQCLRQYLPENVNNALSFTVTQTLVNRPETKSILYGLHSLDAPPSVDEFKFRMGYIAKPICQKVVFHPWLGPLANNLSYAITRNLLKYLPGNPKISKAEGMLRFYLEGNLPLQKQSWPECLTVQREEIHNRRDE
ncbi:MAG TPA: hypothetical protein VK897_02585 [Anaerolineales bacterium]|nr:hypothetical protein [Anaerolineales bacterium]